MSLIRGRWTAWTADVNIGSLTPLDLLDRILNTPPRIIFTHRDTFTGRRTAHERIVSHRYIRILRGRLIYRIDQTEANLGAGVVFFVARGSERSWEVPRGEQCEIVWCEFETPGVRLDPHLIYSTPDSPKMEEKAALLRLLDLWKFPRHLRAGPRGDPNLPREKALLMEGELKASLARFWTRATICEPLAGKLAANEERPHPSVREALVWLEENYQRADAHKQLFSEVIELSPNHFRVLFTKYLRTSVSAHLMRLRMLKAMNLLRTSALTIKEVAGAVGFNDALYFSRCFHEYWDIAPTGVRK